MENFLEKKTEELQEIIDTIKLFREEEVLTLRDEQFVADLVQRKATLKQTIKNIESGFDKWVVNNLPTAKIDWSGNLMVVIGSMWVNWAEVPELFIPVPYWATFCGSK